MTTHPAPPGAVRRVSDVVDSAPVRSRDLARLVLRRLVGDRLPISIIAVLAGSVGVGVAAVTLIAITGADLEYSAVLAYAPALVFATVVALTLTLGAGALRMALAGGATRAAFLRAWGMVLPAAALPLAVACWAGAALVASVVAAAPGPDGLVVSLVVSCVAAAAAWFLGLGLNAGISIDAHRSRIATTVALVLIGLLAVVAGGAVLPGATANPALGWALLAAAAVLALVSTAALVLRAAPTDFLSTLNARENS